MQCIYRDIKEGVYYNSNDFVINNSKLKRFTSWDKTDGNTKYEGYAPEVQKDFTKYFKVFTKIGHTNQWTHQHWEAHTKNGKIFSYGERFWIGTTGFESTQSFRRNISTEDVFKWCLFNVQDTNNNFVLYGYERDSGQIYLKSIYYTVYNDHNNDVELYTNQIIFHLENRDDHDSNYVTNYEVKTRKRLKTIEIKSNDNLVRAYELKYTKSPHSSRSLLHQVYLYGSNATIENGTVTGGSRLPPHQFEYNNFQVDGSHFDNNADSQGKITNLVTRDGSNWLFQTDFNGDGKTDLIKINKSGTGPSYQVEIKLIKKINDSNEFEVVKTESWSIDYPFTTFKIGDFNGDGKLDLFQTVESLYRIEGWYIYASKGESFERVYNEKKVLTPADTWSQDGNNDFIAYALGDFNGDGKSDILSYKISNVSETKNYALYLSPDNSFEFLDNGSFNNNNFDFEKIHEGDLDGGDHNNYAINVQIGDFNGDGKSDVLAIDRRYDSSTEKYSSGYKLFVSSGSSLVFKESKTIDNNISQGDSAYMFYTSRKVFGDFNGDDKTDFLYHNRMQVTDLKDGHISVYHSDGEKFNFKKNIDMNLAQSKYFVGDFNGDNRDDIGAVWDAGSSGNGD